MCAGYNWPPLAASVMNRIRNIQHRWVMSVVYSTIIWLIMFCGVKKNVKSWMRALHDDDTICGLWLKHETKEAKAFSTQISPVVVLCKKKKCEIQVQIQERFRDIYFKVFRFNSERAWASTRFGERKAMLPDNMVSLWNKKTKHTRDNSILIV